MFVLDTSLILNLHTIIKTWMLWMWTKQVNIMEWIDMFSALTTLSSFCVQLVGIEICMRIVHKGSTGDISAAPFLANFVTGCLWVRYGILQGLTTVIIVNLLGAMLAFLYLMIFYVYVVRKVQFLKFLFFGGTILFLPLIYIKYYEEDFDVAVSRLGLCCVIMTIVSYAAPLASLADVLRTKSTECMSFPLVFAYFVVAIEWFIYGSLIKDSFVQMPNVIGIFLGLLQLLLFLRYPAKNTSPIISA